MRIYATVYVIHVKNDFNVKIGYFPSLEAAQHAMKFLVNFPENFKISTLEISYSI